ncbi:hypothetical protein ACFYST_03490 [Kitasatospora sp. NPDC004614]|uniref:hypothetical protein n=1 Tax=unclassified Kitasatospora TaxID=2633591 RepID=UPI003677B890
MNAELAMRLTVGLAAVGVAISSLEYLLRPGLLADDALASWSVTRTSHAWMVTPRAEAMLERLFAYPNFAVVLVLRLLAAAAVMVGPPLPLAALAALIAVSSSLLAQRSPYGTDGADQLTVIIFVGAALSEAIATPNSYKLFLWFISAQACLAYLTAGVAKLASPVWREGGALPGILGTSSYGYRRLGAVLARHQRTFWTLGWLIMALECVFPTALLGIRPLTYTMLAAMLTFHLGAAFLMRLNTFFWAFTATYPSILFCALGSP